MSELQGKRVFVTGSGAGIGKAIAALFVQRGAQVVVSDINAESAKSSAEEVGAAGVANCDVTEEAQVAFVSALTSAAFGLSATGKLDYAWNSFEGALKKGVFFNARRK